MDMAKQCRNLTESAPAAAADVVSPLRLHRLSTVYFIALAFIALTIVASWGVMKYAISRNEGDSRVINLSGRQRMLSQRLTKCALLLAATDSPAVWAIRRAEVVQSLADWEQAHRGLQAGDAELGLPARENTPAVRKLFAEIGPPHAAMVAALRSLLAATADGRPDSGAAQTAAAVLAASEPQFLRGMDAITFQFDGEADERIRRMSNLELVIMCFGLVVLLLEFMVVFRPSLRQLVVLFGSLQAKTAELESANASLVQSARTARLADTTKEEFISIISHDLRGPIGTMAQGLESLLLPGVTVAEQREGIALLHTSAERLNRLTAHLLDWARLQRKQLRVTPVRLDLNAVAREQVELLKDVAAVKTLAVDVAGDVVTAVADAATTGAIVRNLLSNAIKFTPAGGRIVLRAERAGTMAHLTVTDSGIGMTAEQQEKLFNIADYRSRPGTAGEKGTGLGLIVSRDLARRNGGTLTIVSRPGEGTTATLALPAAE